jgi:teichuronic acid biosynthesis glycosyltransferase TuaC
MMRIAAVTRYFPSSAEPWEGRSAYQILRFLAQNADVQVFYPNASYPPLLKPRSRTFDKLDPSFSLPGVKATYRDFPALPLLSRPLNGWMASRALLPDVRRFAPDLIFSFFLYPDGYAALRIGSALSVPVVAMSIGSDLNNIGDPISARLTRTVLSEADFLLTKSEDLRRKAVLMGAPPEKTRVVLNGCDLSQFHVGDRAEARRTLQIDPNAQVVAYIGRMNVKKGLRELVEAATSLHPLRPGLRVYLVGEGPDKAVIEAAVQARGAGSYIHVLSACAPDDVVVWMTAADLVTLPSYMEGCPNVVLEALACGRPVVASQVGGIPEIMSNDCGRLVPPRDAAALAAAIGSVLDQSWDAAAIATHWSRSWSTVTAELMTVFESCLPKSQDVGA